MVRIGSASRQYMLETLYENPTLPVSLPLDGGGRGGGDFHPSLCPLRAWELLSGFFSLFKGNIFLRTIMMRLIRPSVKIVPPIPAISIVTAKVNLSTVYAPFRCKRNGINSNYISDRIVVYAVYFSNASKIPYKCSRLLSWFL